jgi:hypothetical protein
MQAFCNSLNASGWRGVISEVGIGLDFSAGYLRHPGASQTILGINCDYGGIDRPTDMRAVSLENAKRLAIESLAKVRLRAGEYDTQKQFGLAITGAHYEDRPSHAWVYIATPNWDAYMHCSISASRDRNFVGGVLATRVRWFMQSCMLSTDSWVKHIEELGDSMDVHNIDVLYAPGVSDIERLLLLRPKNPLAYVDGKFERAIDVVREYSSVYSGAFNPPTKRHLDFHGVLYEISQQHCYKGGIALEDLLHRMRMLSLSGKAALLTQAPRFIDKRNVLMDTLGMTSIEFVVGADAWNATVAHHQYPSTEYLAEKLGPNVQFTASN